jgi:hypothetical protein
VSAGSAVEFGAQLADSRQVPVIALAATMTARSNASDTRALDLSLDNQQLPTEEHVFGEHEPP